MAKGTEKDGSEQQGGDPVAAARNVDAAGQQLPVGQNAVEAALTGQVALPIFSTHSTSLVGEFKAKAESLKAMAAEIDAKIALLAAEREDIMLAYSMLSHGMQAREKGSRN